MSLPYPSPPTWQEQLIAAVALLRIDLERHRMAYRRIAAELVQSARDISDTVRVLAEAERQLEAALGAQAFERVAWKVEAAHAEKLRRAAG